MEQRRKIGELERDLAGIDELQSTLHFLLQSGAAFLTIVLFSPIRGDS